MSVLAIKILCQIWQVGACPVNFGLSTTLGRLAATGMNRITTHIQLIFSSETCNEHAASSMNCTGRYQLKSCLLPRTALVRAKTKFKHAIKILEKNMEDVHYITYPPCCSGSTQIISPLLDIVKTEKCTNTLATTFLTHQMHCLLSQPQKYQQQPTSTTSNVLTKTNYL